MIQSIELQVISKILTSDDTESIDQLLTFDSSYYSVFKDQIQFILEHYDKYHVVPDIFTFQAEFPDVTLVQVNEPIEYLVNEMHRNKQYIILLETFNRIKDLGADNVSEAWKYIESQCERVEQLDTLQPMDIVHQANERSEQILEFNRQARIPTGFPEIDKLMYGGLSTVEELAIIFARTNTGKSWVCTKMMESAQRNGFPVLYYSPEMQASFLATRFDTWRKQFRNSELHQGKYSDEYKLYINDLEKEETPAFVLEDKDAADGVVNVPLLKHLVRKHNIKLLIIDGLSYMEDTRGPEADHIKYKNICTDLFKLSKQFSCAVVVAMQANRETKNNVEKGAEGKDPMPSLHNLESSDHPGRIATQAFALRQIWDKHILDIRLEKSRNAANQKPMFSYSWDPNTGTMSLAASEDSNPISNISTPMVAPSFGGVLNNPDTMDMLDDSDVDEDIEF